MTSTDSFNLALLQHEPTPCDITASIRRIEQNLINSAEQETDLLLVPEASLTGYNISIQEAQSIATERDSQTTEKIQTICRKHSTALAYGFIEREGNDLYNTVQVIDSNGEQLTHYRKTHLWGDLDRTLFKAGNQFSELIEVQGWKIGLLICYDIEFPECARHYAIGGCELLLTPTALMSPWTYVAEQVAPVRAAENQMYVAYANYCGFENQIEYVGRSCIVAPTGQDLARAHTQTTLLSARLSKEAIENTRSKIPYHNDRRPELYQG